MKKMMLWTHDFPESFKGGKWTYKHSVIEVRVMAIAEKYAMVRRRGAMPFVVHVKELSEPK